MRIPGAVEQEVQLGVVCSREAEERHVTVQGRMEASAVERVLQELEMASGGSEGWPSGCHCS